MKGLILCGGRGSRMSAATRHRPKQLIPVANKPILFYGIEALRKAGIKNIGIVVGAGRDSVRQLCGRGDRWGVRLAYIEQASPLGLGHAVLTAKPFIDIPVEVSGVIEKKPASICPL